MERVIEKMRADFAQVAALRRASGAWDVDDEAMAGRAIKAAIDACERYYQAFQFVVWAGKNAREALEGALLETVGEA